MFLVCNFTRFIYGVFIDLFVGMLISFQNSAGNHVGAYYLAHSKPEQVNALEVPDKPQTPFVNAVQPVNP